MTKSQPEPYLISTSQRRHVVLHVVPDPLSQTMTPSSYTRLQQLFSAMSRPCVINLISSDEEEEEDDVQVLAFHEATQKLIEKTPPTVVKKLCEAECPICFDTIKNATTTFCGHVYCLECLQKSVAASLARGQTRGKKGVGLCPMCRKTVAFKDSIVLRLRKGVKVVPPQRNDESSKAKDGRSLDDEFLSFENASVRDSDELTPISDDELIGLF